MESTTHRTACLTFMQTDENVSSSASDPDEISSSANSYEEGDDPIEIGSAGQIDFSGPDAEAQQRALIEEALVRCGLSGRTLALATLRTEVVFHDMVINAAGTGVMEVLATLGRSPMAEAIRRLLMHDQRPLREAARRIGCSHEALRQAEKKLEAALGGS